MERQLKERLIGAAVLIAIAVILVPEMFSGSRSRTAESAAQDTINSGQLKTYQIDLQASSINAPPAEDSAENVEPTVEPPAPEPQDELPRDVGAVETKPTVQSASVSSASSSMSSRPSVMTVSNKVVAAKVAVADKQKPAPVPVKSVSSTGSGRWAVQIGSFGAQDKAQQIAGKIKSLGFAASVTPIKASGKTLYRVRTGALSERATADAALKKLKAAYPDASVVPIA